MNMSFWKLDSRLFHHPLALSSSFMASFEVGSGGSGPYESHVSGLPRI